MPCRYAVRLGEAGDPEDDMSDMPIMAEMCPGRLGPGAGGVVFGLFSSGATGRPRGGRVAHGTWMRRMAGLTREWGVTAQDRAALATQATFDPSLIEWCLPLVNGACIALAPPGRLRRIVMKPSRAAAETR